MINRRKFIAGGLGLTAMAGLHSVITSCEPKRKISGMLKGPNMKLGHMLRDVKLTAPKQSYKKDIVIVGGGVAGLSAARHLKKSGASFILLELENSVGGNSSYGANDISAYPLGAHYLTLPSLHNTELIDFLSECEVIKSTDQNGKLVFNDYYLCFDPKERLYINGHWQEGLVPRQGVPAADQEEIIRFHELMDYYKKLNGADGKEAFCIPLAYCSRDPELLKLDEITFASFLQEKGLQSPYLLWYVNYCCRDDYGATIENTSAWAGIHYFACHKASGSDIPSDSVLTWPEGNGWLIKQLKQYAKGNAETNVLVYGISKSGNSILIDYMEGASQQTKRIIADKVIVATPQFINQRILSPELPRNIDYNKFTYAPWMVANLSVEGDWRGKRGEGLSWDNVIYGSESLGYVNAGHQSIETRASGKVLTYYSPMTGNDINGERKKVYSATYQDWYSMILKDMKRPHPGIEEQLLGLDVWTWGHGMIRPRPGFIHGATPLATNIDKQIFFAHSDLSGISVFEEAFYQGTKAARELLL